MRLRRAAIRTGNNVWSFTLAVDERRGIVYMPVSGPGMNYYGAIVPRNNLFSNTTVALDALTGKLKWHVQNIRHELWDCNLPPAPGLIDIRKDGTTIPALAQVGKSGWMFILNRVDGTPIVTKGGLVFIGATRDRRFRAFDSRTGKELWSVAFDYNVTAIPITYMGKNGKPYVAVVAATQGQGNNEALHVFTLLERRRAEAFLA